MAPLQRKTCARLAKAHQHERSYRDICALCEWASVFCAKAMAMVSVVHWATSLGVDTSLQAASDTHGFMELHPDTGRQGPSFGKCFLYGLGQVQCHSQNCNVAQEGLHSSKRSKSNPEIQKSMRENNERFLAVVLSLLTIP